MAACFDIKTQLELLNEDIWKTICQNNCSKAYYTIWKFRTFPNTYKVLVTR